MATVRAIEVASAGLVWQNKLLLIKRGKEPSKGLYAFPGGRIEPNETAKEAARREIAEETGLIAGELDHLETIDLDHDKIKEGENYYRLHVFCGAHEGGSPVASDDADEAGWFSLSEIETMPMTASSLRLARQLLAEAH